MRDYTLQGGVTGWHPSEINKSDSDDQKRSPVFFQEKIGMTPSVATPGDTNPRDNNAQRIDKRTPMRMNFSATEVFWHSGAL